MVAAERWASEKQVGCDRLARLHLVNPTPWPYLRNLLDEANPDITLSGADG